MVRKAIFVIAWVFFVSPALSEEWDISVMSELVVASITGNITHGERQRFVFFKRNCETINHVFSTYTTELANFENLKGKVFVIEFNGEKIGAELITAKKAMSGHLLMFNLGTHERGLLLNHLKKHENMSIEFVDGNGLKASDYFDMPKNEWSTKGITEAFGQAYKACSN